jgi:type I restriction enzyme, S subunit
MTTLDQQKFQNLRISIPPLLEQQIIVRFLDYKTAQIDALIAKKEALLAKLAEKRTALIIHVATKGLDPSVPMKDSEVEWLGDVPAHWKVLPLKHAIMFQRGHDLPAGDRIEGDIPLVSSAGISSCHDRAMAKGPGIVTGRYGTIGNFTYVQSDYWPLNTTLYSIKTHNNNEKYLWFMLHMLSGLFILNSKKGAVPGIDRNDLHPVLTVMPLRSEQDVIAEYLEKTTLAIDLHANLIRKTIEKLIEYRSSLITNAVTGKIDVRQFALPTAEQEATHA